MSHYNQNQPPPQKNPPWMRNSLAQQHQQHHHQISQTSILQPVTLTATSVGQTSLGQVQGQLQFAPAMTGQVHLSQPLGQTHLTLGTTQLGQQLLPQAYGQVQINQAQLTSIPIQHQQAPTQFYPPAVSIQQGLQPLGVQQGPMLQPPGVVIPTSITTTLMPPGIAIPTSVNPSQAGSQTFLLGRNSNAANTAVSQTTKQRVFTGTVTKLQDCFGFVDEDVFFHTSCVKGTIPQVGDRVLVEASFNQSMPFKWNATRIQIIGPSNQQHSKANNFGSGILTSRRNDNSAAEWSNARESSYVADRDSDHSSRSTSKARENDWRRERGSSRSPSRKRSRSRSRSRKRSRSRSRSPRTSRRRQRTPRYSVQVPKFSLDTVSATILELRRRYSHLYVPSDFVQAKLSWVESLPAHRPLPLNNSVSFHIFDKDVDPPIENGAVYEAPDADYSYSAKVMLLSLPPLEEFFRKCCSFDEDSTDTDDLLHPARLVQFLVGIRGKNETMAIGGAWSPSLDGLDPQSDPKVLVRTAIRTCRALTGIDLGNCTQWYRFAEIRYARSPSTSPATSAKSRFETVVMFVPDVWSCLPTSTEWQTLRDTYNNQGNDHADSSYSDALDNESDPKAEEENGEDGEKYETKKEPAHYSLLEPKTLKIGELRAELEVRRLNAKGLRSQLVARLSKCLQAEAQAEKQKETEKSTSTEDTELLKEGNGSSQIDLPTGPHILVHPSRTAKGGKFDCALISLSVLLDYRLDDSKEHTFEVSLFSELFNEMLMRDFGCKIYRTLQLEAGKKRDKKDRTVDDEKEAKSAQGICRKESVLLAFSYFDLTHSSYFTEKDLEELLMTLGLQISRAQVRKLIHKVTTKDGLRYKKMLDQMTEDDLEDQVQLSIGDKSLHCNTSKVTSNTNYTTDGLKETDATENTVEVPETACESSDGNGLLNVQGCLVDVGKLINQLRRLEKSRVLDNARIWTLENQLSETRTRLGEAETGLESVRNELEQERRRLESSRQTILRLQSETSGYLKALQEIHHTTGSALSRGAPQGPTKLEDDKSLLNQEELHNEMI